MTQKVRACQVMVDNRLVVLASKAMFYCRRMWPDSLQYGSGTECSPASASPCRQHEVTNAWLAGERPSSPFAAVGCSLHHLMLDAVA